MTELTKINEDNCVLSYADMRSIEFIFSQHKLTVDLKSIESVTKWVDSIFLKITKLNDLAKEAKRENIKL